MDFYEVLDQVVVLLQRRERVTYGALKLQFKLDDEHLQILKEELVEAQRLAIDEDGKVLVWVGGRAKQESENRGIEESEKGQTTSSDARPWTLDPRRDVGDRRQLTVMFCDWLIRPRSLNSSTPKSSIQ